MQISDESLRGRVVIGADGRAIGEVEGLTLDTDGWQLATLQVKLRREVVEKLGLERRLFKATRVDIPRQALQSIGDAVILSISVESLRELTGVPAHDTPVPVH